MWYLSDDAVRSKQAKLSGHPSRGTPSLFVLRKNLREKMREDVTISKTV